jgi:hypothetical protein
MKGNFGLAPVCCWQSSEMNVTVEAALASSTSNEKHANYGTGVRFPQKNSAMSGKRESYASYVTDAEQTVEKVSLPLISKGISRNTWKSHLSESTT